MKIAALLLLSYCQMAIAQEFWTPRSGPLASWKHAVAVNNGALLFSETSKDGGYITAFSYDGINWTPGVLPYAWFLSSGGGIALGVGQNWIWATEDGSTTREDPYRYPQGFTPQAAVFGLGVWVIVGHGGCLRSIDNGKTWEYNPIPAEGFGRVAFGAKEFLATSQSDPVKLFASSDGATWSLRNSNMRDEYMYYGAGRWETPYALSWDGGKTWGRKDTGNFQGDDNTRIEWTGRPAQMEINFAGIFTSTDGFNWTRRESGVAGDISTGCFGGKFYVAAGYGGLITTSILPEFQPKPPVLSAYPAVELSFPTQFGVVYQLQSSPDNATWTNDGATLTGSGETLKLYRPAASARRFWRLVAR